MTEREDRRGQEERSVGRKDQDARYGPASPGPGPGPGSEGDGSSAASSPTVEQAEVAHRTVESRRCQSLVERLQAWVMTPANRPWLEQATHTFFQQPGGYDDTEMEWVHWVFLSWLIHDHVGPDGQTARERFLAEARPQPSAVDQRMLERLGQERFRLVEVQQIRQDEGIDLKDLTSGELFEVRERLATHSLSRWDLLIVRLRRLSSHFELDAACTVPRGLRMMLLEQLDDLLAKLRRRRPEARAEDVLRFLAPAVFDRLILLLRQSQKPPELRTTDGDPLVFCMARFSLLDEEAMSNVLRSHRSYTLDERNGCFAWQSGTRRKGSFAGSRVTLGHVELQEGELTLRTNSRKRLERGKALLLQLGRDLLRHQLDTFEDPAVAFARLRPQRNAIQDAEQLSVKRRQEIESRVLQQHYQRWLDEQVPALSGVTPRQAAADPSLRPRLVALLKDFENRSQRGSGALYDFDHLRRELGIGEEE